MRPSFLARNVERGKASGSQIQIEHTGATRAYHIERTWHRQGRHRQTAGEGFDENHAKSIGAARKHEDIRRGILNREGLARFRAEEMGVPDSVACKARREGPSPTTTFEPGKSRSRKASTFFSGARRPA